MTSDRIFDDIKEILLNIFDDLRVLWCGLFFLRVFTF